MEFEGKMEEHSELDDLNIESKINQIFEEAKKRNPKGYTLKHFSESAASVSSGNNNLESSSYNVNFNVSVNVSRSSSSSSSVSPTNFSSFYPNPHHSRSSSYGSIDSEEKESGTHLFTNQVQSSSSSSSFRGNTYMNPKSGQKFCILATTVNVPLNLQLID